MDGMESFLGMDQDKPMSEAAFEAFKDKMAGAAKDLKAWGKGEQKQKAKEDELYKILKAYLQRSGKSSFVLLIARLLEENVPAGFVLGIILLGDKEIQKDLNLNLSLPHGTEEAVENSTMLTLFGIEDQTLPLRAKIEIDYWTKNLLEQALLVPQRIVKTVEEKTQEGQASGKPKLIAIQLTSFVLREFLSQYKLDTEFENVQHFALFVLSGILRQVHTQLDGQNLLGE